MRLVAGRLDPGPVAVAVTPADGLELAVRLAVGRHDPGVGTASVVDR